MLFVLLTKITRELDFTIACNQNSQLEMEMERIKYHVM